MTLGLSFVHGGSRHLANFGRIPQKALTLSPNPNPNLDPGGGGARRVQEHYETAIYHFQQLLESKPTHYVALAQLVLLMRRSGRLAEVPRYLRMAEKSSPRAVRALSLSLSLSTLTLALTLALP